MTKEGFSLDDTPNIPGLGSPHGTIAFDNVLDDGFFELAAATARTCQSTPCCAAHCRPACE